MSRRVGVDHCDEERGPVSRGRRIPGGHRLRKRGDGRRRGGARRRRFVVRALHLPWRSACRWRDFEGSAFSMGRVVGFARGRRCVSSGGPSWAGLALVIAPRRSRETLRRGRPPSGSRGVRGAAYLVIPAFAVRGTGLAHRDDLLPHELGGPRSARRGGGRGALRGGPVSRGGSSGSVGRRRASGRRPGRRAPWSRES